MKAPANPKGFEPSMTIDQDFDAIRYPCGTPLCCSPNCQAYLSRYSGGRARPSGNPKQSRSSPALAWRWSLNRRSRTKAPDRAERRGLRERRRQSWVS